jgi:hypothetical protein
MSRKRMTWIFLGMGRSGEDRFGREAVEEDNKEGNSGGELAKRPGEIWN